MRAPSERIPRIVWIAATGGMLAVMTVGALGHRPPFYMDDGAIAVNLLDGKGFTFAFHGPEGPTAARAPLQPFVLAAVHGAFGFSSLGLVVVLLVRALAHAATAVLTYVVARRAAPARVATWAGVLVALHPVLIWFAGNTNYLDRRATLSLPLEMLALVACLVASERRTTVSALSAGLAIGLVALSEPPLLYFALLAAVVVAGGIRGRLRLMGAVVLGAALVTAPWLTRNALVFGRPTALRSAFGLLLWMGNNPQASGVHQDQVIEDDPGWRPARVGTFLVRGHPTTFGLRAAGTLTPDVRERLAVVDEAQRSRILLTVALEEIWRNPGRFASVTARRLAYVVVGPPLGERAGRLVDPAIALALRPVGVAWPGGVSRVDGLIELLAHAVLAAAVFVAVVGLFLSRGRFGALVGGVLGTWAIFFGLTHCGLWEYRIALDPLVASGVVALMPALSPRWGTLGMRAEATA